MSNESERPTGVRFRRGHALVCHQTIVFLLLPLLLLMIENDQVGAQEVSAGVYLNARGFFSLGVYGEYKTHDRYSLRPSVELPLLLAGATKALRSWRLGFAVPFDVNRRPWNIQAVPEAAYTNQHSVLGTFKTLSIGLRLRGGYWSPASRSDSDRLGATVGLSWAPVSWFDPSEFVLDTFTGLPDAPPETGMLLNTRTTVLLGGFVWGTTPAGIADAEVGVAVSPRSVSAFGSGMPYGELPFYMQIGLESF